MTRKHFLLSPGAGADDGTGTAPTTATAHNAPQIGTSEPTTKPPPGAGPASVIVATGTKSERELELEREAEELRQAVKDRERTICEQQDKHENYRKSVEQTKPTPKKKIGAGWFESDEVESVESEPS